MQLDDSNIHKLFVIKTIRYTNMSSKLHIVIMKTTHNINHAIYAMHADVLLLNCWTGLLLGCYCVTAGLLHALYSMLHALCYVLDQ
jgi:hypothetical protein